MNVNTMCTTTTYSVIFYVTQNDKKTKKNNKLPLFLSHISARSLILRDEIKSSGKFAILYLYKIGGGRGSRGTFGKINVQDSIFA